MVTRVRAALIHLSASLLIAVLVAGTALFVWYPPPLLNAAGGQQLVFMIVAIDVIVGPLLTFVVFDTRKRSLKLDMVVIVLLQLIALGYGLYTFAVARPAFVVFAGDRFDLVTAVNVDTQSLSRSRHSEFRSLPLTGPIWAGAELPVDPKEREALFFESVRGGADVSARPEYFVPLELQLVKIAAAAKPVADLHRFNQDRNGELNAIMTKLGMGSSDLAYLPLKARQDMVVIVERPTGRVRGVFDFAPW